MRNLTRFDFTAAKRVEPHSTRKLRYIAEVRPWYRTSAVKPTSCEARVTRIWTGTRRDWLHNAIDGGTTMGIMSANGDTGRKQEKFGCMTTQPSLRTSTTGIRMSGRATIATPT